MFDGIDNIFKWSLLYSQQNEQQYPLVTSLGGLVKQSMLSVLFRLGRFNNSPKHQGITDYYVGRNLADFGSEEKKHHFSDHSSVITPETVSPNEGLFGKCVFYCLHLWRQRRLNLLKGGWHSHNETGFQMSTGMTSSIEAGCGVNSEAFYWLCYGRIYGEGNPREGATGARKMLSNLGVSTIYSNMSLGYRLVSNVLVECSCLSTYLFNSRNEQLAYLGSKMSASLMGTFQLQDLHCRVALTCTENGALRVGAELGDRVRISLKHQFVKDGDKRWEGSLHGSASEGLVLFSFGVFDELYRVRMYPCVSMVLNQSRVLYSSGLELAVE
eukprot:Nk52_evm16s2171 gene=Nk52_evmTU16s2171